MPIRSRGGWSTMASTQVFASISNWSTSAHVFVSTASTSLVGWGKPHKCTAVELSTVDGAKCACGKLTIPVSALNIKQQTLGEVRQIVASGYKLVHGEPLAKITWK